MQHRLRHLMRHLTGRIPPIPWGVANFGFWGRDLPDASRELPMRGRGGDRAKNGPSPQSVKSNSATLEPRQ
jgi:hypothetical protein